MEPNGLAFSPDEKKLYVVDTGFTDGPDNPSHIRVFDVDVGTGKVSNLSHPTFLTGSPPAVQDGASSAPCGPWQLLASGRNWNWGRSRGLT